jgi:hypothetical protein
MGFVQDVRDELKAEYSGKRVILKFGALGQIEFERKEFLDLWAVQDQVAEIVNKTFSERLVTHADMKAERPGYCIESLQAGASALDQKRGELRAILPSTSRSILTVLENLRTEFQSSAKTIRNTASKMDEGNAGEYDSTCRVEPSDWLPDVVRQFRIRTYPSFKFLIELLPDDNTKERAENLWFEGLNALSNREKLSSQPSAQILK